MVASLATVTSATSASEYFMGLARSDYYLAGGEPPGRWFGEAARFLGLRGEVFRESLENLLQGKSPDGLRTLLKSPAQRSIKTRAGESKIASRATVKSNQATVNRTSASHNDEQNPKHKPTKTSKERQPLLAIDLTLSAPKSVSVLWAVSDRATRRKIDRAMLRAVHETLRIAERHLPLARRGKGGAKQETAKLAAALFPHTTNRNGEPQKHVHCLIMNAVRRMDGSWSTLNSRAVFQWSRTLGPLFHSQLARELRRSLSLEFERHGGTSGKSLASFEISGVPHKLCELWSSRSRELKELIAGSGVLGKALRGNLSAKTKQQANLKSRRAKQKLPPLKELLTAWKQVAHEFEFDGRNLPRNKTLIAGAEREELFALAFKGACKRLTEQKAHFSAREVIRWTAEFLEPLAVQADWIFSRTSRELAHSREIIALQNERGEKQFTTRKVWEYEQALFARMERLQKSKGPALEPKLVDRLLKRNAKLSSEQIKAVRLLWRTEGRMKLLAGVAGAGKSFVLDVLRQGYEQQGYRVIGGALAGAAKEELIAKSRIPSRTVASLLYHLEKPPHSARKEQARRLATQLLRAALGKTTWREQPLQLDAKTVLVIDEAAMIDTRTLWRLAKLVDRAGATLVLVGDDKQLPAIEGAAPFRALREKFPHALLQDNRRQQDAADRETVKNIREGDLAKAIGSYHERGLLTIGRNRSDTLFQLVDCWRRQGGLATPKDHLLFAQTRAETAALNRLCQSARRTAGKLGITHLQIEGAKYHGGDRVLFHEPLRKYGIENGQRGVVRGINLLDRQLIVELDQPPRKWFEPQRSRFITIPAQDLRGGYISLGYAATSHKLQGQTVRHAYLLLGGGLDSQEMFYVQASRGAESTRLFVDRLAAGQDFQQLVKSLSQSSFKKLAHQVGRELTPMLQHERERTP